MSLEVWDYVFLQSNHYPSKCGIPKATLDCLRAEFQYWYPVDVRMSGKDLVQNHLTYFIYCHTAMWPKDKSVSALSSLSFCCLGWGCSSVGRASNRHVADAGSIPRCGKRFFPTVNFQCRLFYVVRTPPCTIACIYICAHVKDPVVHVRVLWIMKTLKPQHAP